MLVDILENVISVSVSLSVVTALLLFIAPYLEERYSFQWWRFIWLVLSLRLIFFFRVFEPVISKETATIDVDLNPVAFTHKLNTASSLLDSNSHSVWQEVWNYSTNISVLEVVALIWITVVILRLVFNFIGYYIFRRTMKKLKHNEIAPIIILPIREYNEEEIEFILRHELMHVKQHDIWYKFILFISKSIHWFNSIIRVAFRKANHDLELECDSKVIENRGENYKKAYSCSLLEIMNDNLNAKKLCQSFSFTTNYSGGKKAMKKRLKNILDTKGKKNGTTLLIMALSLVLISSGLIACSSNKEKSDEDIKVTTDSPNPTNNSQSEDSPTPANNI